LNEILEDEHRKLMRQVSAQQHYPSAQF